MLDSYRRPITEGAKVAYNLSGELAFGVVQDIKTTQRYGQERHVFHVAQVGSRNGTGSSRLNTLHHVSKVTNPRNLVVLDEFPSWIR